MQAPSQIAVSAVTLKNGRHFLFTHLLPFPGPKSPGPRSGGPSGHRIPGPQHPPKDAGLVKEEEEGAAAAETLPSRG